MMDTEYIAEGVKLISDRIDKLRQGPLDYTMRKLLAAHSLLLNRFAPFKVGDRVEFAITPVINKTTRHGWIGRNHFLKEGAAGYVRGSDVTDYGNLVFDVEFDDETWIDSYTKERHIPEHKHWYSFSEAQLRMSDKP